MEFNVDIQSRRTVKNDIGGIRRLLEEVSEDPPRRNAEPVIPGVVPANVHQPDEHFGCS
jgi:hypothetical protein